MPEKKAAPKKADHPTYAVMIAAAVASLKDRKGSSKQAIGKYICANYKVGPTYNAHLKMALKRGVESGALVQTKGTGASGSFKIAKVEKEAKKPAAKKPAAKKAAPKPAAKKSPKKATKKPAAKKAATKKAPAKVVKKASPKKVVKKTVKKPAAKKTKAKK